MATISVIVPVYKVEKWLEKCVESIINQTYKNLEIILVDDGSPDNCGKICDDYAKRDERIKVIHKTNGGQGSARNMALDVAVGEYIMFADSDDYLAEDICEALHKAIIDEKADISVCGYFLVSEGIVCGDCCTTKDRVVFNNIEGLKTYYEGHLIYPAPWCKLYKKELWRDIRFPENLFREDEYIFYEVLAKAEKTVHIGDAKYYYNIRQGSAENSGFSLRNLISNDSIDRQYEFIKKNYPELRNIVWDKRIEIRIMQISDISKCGGAKKYKKEFDEMLCFIKNNEPNSEALKKTCEKIMKYKDKYFLKQRVKRYLRQIMLNFKIYKMVRKIRNIVKL